MTLLVIGKFSVNNHAHLLKGRGECTTEWVYYFYQHADITPYITRQGAGRFKLNKAALQELPIIVPPLAEQRKIAAILSTWDEAIALTEQLIEALKRRKQALMQLPLRGGAQPHSPRGRLDTQRGRSTAARMSKRLNDAVLSKFPLARVKSLLEKIREHRIPLNLRAIAKVRISVIMT